VVTSEVKRCSKCKILKPFSEFWNSKRYNDGKYPSCSDCQKITNNKWIKKNQQYLKEYRVKYNITSRRIYSRLLISDKCSLEEFKKWFESQPKQCYYCGVKLGDLKYQEDSQLKRFNKTLSIDRKDSTIGYYPNNMALACMRCNFIKSDFFSCDEMIAIGDNFVKPKHSKRG
jgi:hypothetical protein